MALISAQSIQVLATLRKNDVRFLVIGGQAETLMGGTRPTFDTDVAHARDPENLRRMAAALRELDAKLRVHGQPLDVPYPLDERSLAFASNLTFCTNLGEDLDIMGWVEPIGTYEDLLHNAERHRVADFEVDTIGLQDLIRIKEHLVRQKDKDSLHQLRAIQQVRARGAD